MPKPLPEHVGSLSKYIGAQDHDNLLAYITHDTPSTELRAKFGDNLYATARARYLIVEGEVVLRDRLIDLVHEEGAFTERVKMVMYFLFMFRDRRYREFICRVVGHNNGKWDAKVFPGRHGDFFKNAAGTK